MQWYKKFISASLITASLLLLGSAVIENASASTLRVVQARKMTLYAGIGSLSTSMIVTPYPKDLNGTKLAISDLGSYPTVTVDPGVNGIEEIISFTGITDNGNNTATLTGLLRNLYSKYPYTTTGIGRTHGATAVVVFGNNPQIYGRLAAKENNETISGLWTYSSTSVPKVDMNPSNATWSGLASSTLVTLGKLTDTALASAVAGNISTVGYFQQSRHSQASSSDATGSTGANLVVGSNLVSAIPSGTSTIPMAQPDGKLLQGWFDLSKIWSFTGGLLTTASSTFTATTTFTGNTLGSNIFHQFNAGETITGQSVPQPVYISTTTNQVFLSDANERPEQQFIGFAVSGAASGATTTVQVAGIAKGFTGLTRGVKYYVSDTVGTLSTTVGTSEVLVGTAVSPTEILIDTNGTWQYLGSSTFLLSTNNLNACTATATTSPLGKNFIAKISVENGGTPEKYENTFTFTRYGATSVTGSYYTNNNAYYGGATVAITNDTVLLSGTGVSDTATNYTCGGTLYFYR